MLVLPALSPVAVVFFVFDAGEGGGVLVVPLEVDPEPQPPDPTAMTRERAAVRPRLSRALEEFGRFELAVLEAEREDRRVGLVGVRVQLVDELLRLRLVAGLERLATAVEQFASSFT